MVFPELHASRPPGQTGRLKFLNDEHLVEQFQPDKIDYRWCLADRPLTALTETLNVQFTPALLALLCSLDLKPAFMQVISFVQNF